MYGLPSGVTSSSQVKKMDADALTETVPRLALESRTNCIPKYGLFWYFEATDGHVLAWVATKNHGL